MIEMSVRKKVVSNVFYSFWDTLVLSVTGLIFWILMGKLLVPEEYGILRTVISLYSILFIIPIFGSSEVATKFISEYVASDKSKIKPLVTFLMKTSFLMCFVASLLLFIFSEKIAILFYESSEMVFPLRLLSILLFIGGLTTISKAIIRGFQEFRLMFIIDIISSAFKIGVTLILFFIGVKSSAGVIGWISHFFICLVICIIFLRKFISNNSRTIDKRQIIKYSLASLITIISINLISQIGPILLGLISNMYYVGIYGVAVVLGQVIMFIPVVIINATFPTFSSLWAKKNVKRFELMVEYTVKYILILTTPAMIFLIVFSSDIIQLMYKSQYLEAKSVFIPYFLAYLIISIYGVFFSVMYVIGQTLLRTKIAVFGAVMNAIFSYIFILKYNIIGAAIAYLITVIFLFIVSIFYLKRKIKINFLHYLFGYLFSSMIFLFICLFINSHVRSIFIKMILGVVSSFLYLFTLLIFKVVDEKDMLLLESIPKNIFTNIVKKWVKKIFNIFKTRFD